MNIRKILFLPSFVFHILLFTVKALLILLLFATLLGNILKILLFLVFCMVCYWSSVTRVGVLTPIHWELKNKKSFSRCRYIDRGNPPFPHPLNITYHNVNVMVSGCRDAHDAGESQNKLSLIQT